MPLWQEAVGRRPFAAIRYPESDSYVDQNRLFLNFFFFLAPRREFSIQPRANPKSVAIIIQTTIWLATYVTTYPPGL